MLTSLRERERKRTISPGRDCTQSSSLLRKRGKREDISPGKDCWSPLLLLGSDPKNGRNRKDSAGEEPEAIVQIPPMRGKMEDMPAGTGRMCMLGFFILERKAAAGTLKPISHGLKPVEARFGFMRPWATAVWSSGLSIPPIVLHLLPASFAASIIPDRPRVVIAKFAG